MNREKITLRLTPNGYGPLESYTTHEILRRLSAMYWSIVWRPVELIEEVSRPEFADED
jgi:hypothetical protein